jgi:ubiquinone/menaquinone biosynthesis C-methylase UbiE
MVNWEAPKPVGIVVPACNASGPKEHWYDEDQIVERDRNVDAFDRRASEYERGYLADWHRIVVARSVDVALAARPTARRVLDVGCGTGALLRLVAARLPAADRLDGVDAAAGMVAAGNAIPGLDPRIRLQVARAEQLPFGDGQFDLVVSTTSFDHWGDQRQGLTEVTRVLCPSGRLVLVDLSAAWLAPTTLVGRRGQARTPRQVERLLTAAGLRLESRKPVYNLGPLRLVQSFVAAH